MFIWLASYPKSGNTLVRSLLSSPRMEIIILSLIKTYKSISNIKLEDLGIDIQSKRSNCKIILEYKILLTKKIYTIFKNT